jgi:hypothetical protein
MAAGLTMIFSASALAKAPINTDGRGVTIKGYDTVAYFTEGTPVKGKDKFSFEWMGDPSGFSGKHRCGVVHYNRNHVNFETIFIHNYVMMLTVFSLCN